jgi:hypothetical protein
MLTPTRAASPAIVRFPHAPGDGQRSEAMGTEESFQAPLLALADRPGSDPLETARSLITCDFAHLGRCVLLFRDRRAAEDARRSYGSGRVVAVADFSALRLILDTQLRHGSTHVAVDLVRTPDGQTACDFLTIASMLEACQAAGETGDGLT